MYDYPSARNPFASFFFLNQFLRQEFFEQFSFFFSFLLRLELHFCHLSALRLSISRLTGRPPAVFAGKFTVDREANDFPANERVPRIRRTDLHRITVGPSLEDAPGNEKTGEGRVVKCVGRAHLYHLRRDDATAAYYWDNSGSSYPPLSTQYRRPPEKETCTDKAVSSLFCNNLELVTSIRAPSSNNRFSTHPNAASIHAR